MIFEEKKYCLIDLCSNNCKVGSYAVIPSFTIPAAKVLFDGEEYETPVFVTPETNANVKIVDSGIERAKEIMKRFGESPRELSAIVSVSKFLKFDVQLQDDFLDKNGITISYELYNVMKRYEDENKNYTFRNEYHIFWTRNELVENGEYPNGDYDPFSGYSGEGFAVEIIKHTEQLFEEFANGKLDVLPFFGLYLI